MTAHGVDGSAGGRGASGNEAKAGCGRGPSSPASGSAERRRLWLFNLDAELELARAGGPYQTPLRVARALAPMLDRARVLMRPGDESVDPLGAAGTPLPRRRALAPERLLGCAWCPTPSALRRLADAGAELPPTPAPDVLRRVLHRRFAIELGGGAPGARYVSDCAELARALEEPREAWLFKRAYGFAGRGQRRIVGAPSADDRRWLSDSLRQGGFVAEPWLTLVRELSLHGMLDASGRFELGRLCVQETDRYRAWVSTRRARAGDVSSAQASALTTRAAEVAAALAAAGYFGPFGIDAYLFRTPSGAIELNALSELNARYSMGFAVGFSPGSPGG